MKGEGNRSELSYTPRLKFRIRIAAEPNGLILSAPKIITLVEKY